MHRTILFTLLLCIFVFLPSVSLGDCNDLKNQDKWHIRKPTEEEILQWGKGILIFEYLNHVSSCSNSIPSLGIWFEGKRYLTLSVTTLGRNYDNQEQVIIHLDPSIPYRIFESNTVLLYDSNDFHQWILYPLIS